MYKKLIAEAEWLCKTATEGPWTVKTNRHPETTGESWGWIDGPCDNWTWSKRRIRSLDNAKFIARSRTLIPELVEALKESQRREQAAIADLSGHCEYCAFRNDCAKHDNNDSEAGFTWWVDCEDWKWRGETDGK